MNLYISLKFEHFNLRLGSPLQYNNPDEIAQQNQIFNRCCEIWENFALSKGGKIINNYGPLIILCLSASYLNDIANIKSQTEQLGSSDISLGIGHTVDQAELARIYSEGNQYCISLYNQEVDKWIECQKDKVKEELKLNEAQPEFDPLVKDLKDLESKFHHHARKQYFKDSANDKLKEQKLNDLKQKTASTLMQLKAQLPILEQLRESAPEAYDSVIKVTQSMVALARKLSSNEQSEPEEIKLPENVEYDLERLSLDLLPFEKEYNEDPRAKELAEKSHELGPIIVHNGMLLVGHLEVAAARIRGEREILAYVAKDKNAQASSGESKPHKITNKDSKKHGLSQRFPVGTVRNGRMKIRKPDGSTTWVRVKSGLVMGPEGVPTSARGVDTVREDEDKQANNET